MNPTAFRGPLNDGWLPDAEPRPSPNQDARPVGQSIDLLVIHNISLPPGHFGGPWIDDLFLNRLDPSVHPFFRQIANRRVSAHLLIRRDGALIQYVGLWQRAWHAGESLFAGRRACNDFSIGIELEGTDEVPYTAAQYRVLVGTIRQILACCPRIDWGRIVGHSDIAPGRKTDPGPSFDWARLRRQLAIEPGS
ncbi:1,6-anhydro-N-acetylmuramyl-L-alanine amidase AmpD [Thioalkalicoccus limnaeus]|uniref:1,6-anhydro-N-acetylmuramyl-L-alanine amidase AmpD n=1 Tax=Thioalkalicoccus limnaeus TaxID=120681 RepID=A0ABV4BAH4_9GAMM